MLFFKNSDIKTLPSQKRLDSFIKYFDKLNFESNFVSNFDKATQKISKVIKNKDNFIFISMPPFRSFWVFLIPRAKVILDIRDGWSIAQKYGYGGTSHPKPLKAKVSRVVESLIIKRSYITITCTPGLQQYLSKVSKRNIVLIPNGIDDSDYELIKELKRNEALIKKSENETVFCCAGKFSEYGKEKVTTLLEIIASRYPHNNLRIQLIGSAVPSNQWVKPYFHDLTEGRGKVEILPRLNKSDLFSRMLEADYGLVIVRDPDYEFGTKVYDYIALGLPIINYFDKPNNFTKYFNIHLDLPFNTISDKPEIRRSTLIENALLKYFETD